MTTPASADPVPVARLSGPAELAAALPHLCGFVPTESLVVVTLRGPRRRVSLTMRFDLPPPAHDEVLVAEVVERVLCSGAGAALAVLCTGSPDDHDLPRARLVRRLRAALRGAGVAADDALLVRDGRWSSYLCRDARCCPPGGTPLQGAGSSTGLGVLASVAALDGRAVLASRDELVRSLAPPQPTPAAVTALAAARADVARTRGEGGRTRAGRAGLEAWRRTLAAAPSTGPTVDQVAALVVALEDVAVRDEVLTSLLDDDERLLWVLLRVVEGTPAPDDAQACAVLGWVAHARGDGAVAGVALERALASDPGCTLAQLGRQALDGQVTPTELRALVADSRQAARAAHPWALL